MPIYEYRCPNGHIFEVIQSMSEEPVAECERCGAPVERVFHPVAVHFKGSGFYSTDYAKARTGTTSDDGSKPSEGSKGDDDDSKRTGGEKSKAGAGDD